MSFSLLSVNLSPLTHVFLSPSHCQSALIDPLLHLDYVKHQGTIQVTIFVLHLPVCPWSKGPFKEPSIFLSIRRWGSDLPPSPSLSLCHCLSPSLPLPHLIQLSSCFSPVIFLSIPCVDLSLHPPLFMVKFRDRVRELSWSTIAVCRWMYSWSYINVLIITRIIFTICSSVLVRLNLL